MSSTLDGYRRVLGTYVLCLSTLMVCLDWGMVTVALPSIVKDMRVSGTSITWLLNAYALSLGGFLVLSGKLGDLHGRRRLFLIGVGIFTSASLAGGLAHSQTTLIIVRAIQGLGGAAINSVSLSLILNLFTKPTERAWAIALTSLVSTAGGSLGELLGGFLTKALSWHWIFLVNVPMGIAVYILCIVLFPRDVPARESRQVDIAGAITITAALTAADYALVEVNEAGWASIQTQGLFGAAVLLLLLFLSIETRVREPLVPLRLFRLRSFVVGNMVGVLWVAGRSAWVLLVTLYLQYVLGYDPLRVGLAFLPADAIFAAFSLGLSARIVGRFGIRGPLWIGLLLSAVGLAWFGRTMPDGTFFVDVLPGMIFLGLGGGMVSAPLLLGALKDVDAWESGLASGIVTTSYMFGATLGVAVLSSLADLRTRELKEVGVNGIDALNGGYHLGFLVASFITVVAAAGSVLVIRRGSVQLSSHQGELGVTQSAGDVRHHGQKDAVKWP